MITIRNGVQNSTTAALLLLLFFLLPFSSCRQRTVKHSVPSKIVCLSPSGAEILCAIGAFDKIVARTEFCDYPEEMKSIPSVGGFDGKSLSVEKVMSFNPDFVYGAEGMHNILADQLSLLGIASYLGNGAEGISETKSEIAYISSLLKKDSAGQAVVRHIEKQLQSVPKTAPLVSVYYEVWNEPFITAGKNSLINELLEAAGYKNIFGTLEESYPAVSEESIIARQPQLIIVPDSNGISLASIKSRNGWGQIPAVKNNCIFFIDADLISRPGPRIADAVTALYGIMQHCEHLPEN